MEIDTYLENCGLIKIKEHKHTGVVNKLKQAWFSLAHIKRFIDNDQVKINKKGEVVIKL